MSEKPLRRKGYGSIPHLPRSKLGIGDKRITEGQANICWVKPRNKHDLIVVQEKVDGSCVSILNENGNILAITRAGYLATSSQYQQHHMFDAWVKDNEERFRSLLMSGERVVGEWLAQAHGTKYNLTHEPFVAFDIMTEANRVSWTEFTERVSGKFTTPRLIHTGTSFPELEMLKAMEYSGHGGEWCEGVIYRVYQRGKFDFCAKYVRDDYVAGKYLKGITGHEDVWNWLPRKDRA